MLTLKLYDALETHSQFNLSNAVTGATIIAFILKCNKVISGNNSLAALANSFIVSPPPVERTDNAVTSNRFGIFPAPLKQPLTPNDLETKRSTFTSYSS